MAFSDMTTLMMHENIEIDTVLGYWFNRLSLFRLGYQPTMSLSLFSIYFTNN